jgi:hypothetical protein
MYAGYAANAMTDKESFNPIKEINELLQKLRDESQEIEADKNPTGNLGFFRRVYREHIYTVENEQKVKQNKIDGVLELKSFLEAPGKLQSLTVKELNDKIAAIELKFPSFASSSILNGKVKKFLNNLEVYLNSRTQNVTVTNIVDRNYHSL